MVHHGEAVNVNVIDYVEAADHHLDLPDAQVEEEEVVVVVEPVSLTNIEKMLRNARAFRELSPAETVGPHVGTMQRCCHPRK